MSTMMSLPSFCPYSAYKPSAVPWLGDMPAHWEVRRLLTVVNMRVSNVDKHTREDEISVRLCNYVDVYKNDRITPALPFMAATASRDEIERFRVESGDVLITKDSETWDDIGVPALVAESAHDLLSGYHLALLRPTTEILGSYLARTLESKGVAYQFHVRANGVTRYGLTHTAIQSVRIPLPPPSEQAAIVRYLGYVDRRIRRYVAAKWKLIALLEEERQAIINRAVIRSLDPNVRLKPSRLDWLGDVPEHWEVARFSRQVNIAEGQVDPKIEPHASMLLIAPNHLEPRTGRLSNRETASEQGAISGKYFCRAGDVIYSKIRPALAKVLVAPSDCLCNADMYPLRPRNSLQGDYLFWLLLSEGFTAWSVLESDRVAMPKINRKTLNNLHIPIPPLAEQAAIVEYLVKATADLDAAIARSRRQIELLQEYRIGLVTDVVTGKLDVREAAAQLPDETDDQDPIEESGPPADGLEEVLYDADESVEELAMEREVTA